MSKFQIHKGYSAVAMLIVTVMVAMSVSARSVKNQDSSAARKADYIFLEALKYNKEGSKDAYYELIERAYELNPDDKYLGKEYGCKLLLESGDSATVIHGLDLVRDYVMANPYDLYAGTLYGALADHIGRPEEAVKSMALMHQAHPDRTDVSLKYLDMLITYAEEPADFKHALELTDTLERAEGVSPDFSMRRMRIYEAQADTAAIKNEMQKLLKSAPDKSEYNTFAGQLYLGMGDVDSARIYFDRAVEIDPTNGSAYYNRATFYNQIGDSVAYDREVFQAMMQPDLDIEPKLEILRDYVIKLFRDSTQTERLVGLFRGLTDRYPHEPMVRNLYADYLIAIHDYAGAAEQKSYELDMVPGDEREWVVLSSLYLQSQDFAKSSAAAERGLHYFPSAISLYEIGSAAQLSLENDTEAMNFIRRGLEVADSTDNSARSRLIGAMGDIYYRMEKLDTAFAYYNEAIELDPENLSALNNCAYYLACQDMDLDRATELIERVMAERKDDPTSLDTYAWVLFKRKDFEKAREIIDLAIELSEEPSSDLFDHAGDIYFMDGQPEKAVDFWKKALTLSTDDQLIKRRVKYKRFFYKDK